MYKDTHNRVLSTVQDRGIGLETNKDIIHFYNLLIDQIKNSKKEVGGQYTGFNYDELHDARVSVLSTYLSELAKKGKSITDEELPVHNSTISGAIEDIGHSITAQPYWIDGDFFLEDQYTDPANSNVGANNLLTLVLVVPKRRKTGSPGSLNIGTLRDLSNTLVKVTHILNG